MLSTWALDVPIVPNGDSRVGEPQKFVGGPLAVIRADRKKCILFSSLLPFPFPLPRHCRSLLRESNGSLQLQHVWLGRFPLTSFTHLLLFQQDCHCLCHHSLGSAASSKVQSTHFQTYRWDDPSGILVCCAKSPVLGYGCPNSCKSKAREKRMTHVAMMLIPLTVTVCFKVYFV